MNTEPKTESPPKTCDITQVLATALIEMLRDAPTNSVVRAQVLATILVPIPDTLVEFNAIKDWIETNIKPPAATKSTAGISVEVSCTRGSASGADSYRLTAAELTYMLDQSDDLDEFIAAAEEHLLEIATANID